MCASWALGVYSGIRNESKGRTKRKKNSKLRKRWCRGARAHFQKRIRTQIRSRFPRRSSMPPAAFDFLNDRIFEVVSASWLTSSRSCLSCPQGPRQRYQKSLTLHRLHVWIWQGKPTAYRPDLFKNTISKDGIMCIEVVVHEDHRGAQSMLDNDIT